MNKKRVEKNLKKIMDNIAINIENVQILNNRVLIDISSINDTYFNDIENFILSLNDNNIILNKMHKKIALF